MSSRRFGCTPLLALVLGLAAHEPVRAFDLAGTSWARTAARHGLAPNLLYAVALAESGRPRAGGGLAPWAWTLHLPGRGGGRFLASREAALAVLRAQPDAAAGADVGLMQVNLRWHGHRVRTFEELLEPRRNLEVAALILAEALARSPGDLELGIGRYHTAHEARARAYGRTVLTIRDALDRLSPVPGPS